MKRLSVALLVTGALLLWWPLPGQTQAAINSHLSFQGKLTNPDGTNVTDGNYSIRFRIYTDPSADTGSCANTCKWEETQGSVAVSGGLFHVQLGSVTSLPGSVDFNNATLYLGIKVSTDAEMTPRVRLTAAPYAFNSDLLDGLDASALVQLSPGSQQTGTINVSGTITSGAVNGITIGNTIQPSAAGALTVQANGANALNLTGGAASLLSTTAGVLTVQGAGGVTINTPDTSGASSSITVQSGNSSSGTAGSISIDTGTTSTGTPTISLGSTNTKALQIGNNSSNPAISIDSGTGAILIGTGAQVRAINLGTGAAAQTVTMGSTNGTSSLVLQAGSGNITLNSAVLQRTAVGTTTLNLIDSSDTILSVTNTSTGAAFINADGGYRVNGTAGATATCSGGQFLQNQVVVGGLVTGGTCAAGGGGSPGGSDTNIQFNNSGALGGESDFAWNQTTNTLNLGGVDTGLVLAGVTNEPSAPASDTLRVYSKAIAGRMMLKWKGPSGLDQVIQPSLFYSAIRMLIPNGNNTVTTWGIPNTAVGTLTAPTFATTNLKTSINRIRIVSATTANSASEMRSAVNQVWRGNAAGLGGFYYSATFAVNSTTANQRLFVGLMNATGATSTSAAPSSLTNTIGVGWDSADSNLQIMHNDASGTATKVDLGAGFPTNTTAAVYELTLFATANGSSVSYRLKRLDTETATSGTLSTNLPLNTTFLCRHEYMNNGGSLAAVDLEVMRVYLESDY